MARRRGAHRFDFVEELEEKRFPGRCYRQGNKGHIESVVTYDRLRSARRHGDRKDIQPVPQIFPESAFGDLLLQIAIGGGDDADIDFDRAGAAHALELAILDHAQQLRLQFQRQFADFIQKEGGANSRRQCRMVFASGLPPTTEKQRLGILVQ